MGRQLTYVPRLAGPVAVVISAARLSTTMDRRRATSSTASVTMEALAALPDDEHRYDLLRGELRRMPPGGFEHGAIVATVTARLDALVRERRLGRVVGAETGFVLGRDPDTVLAPDAAFVRGERLPPPEQRKGFLELAPDLVVEVVSPSDRASEVTEKALLWLDAGVRLVWVIYPDPRVVAVYRPAGSFTWSVMAKSWRAATSCPACGSPSPTCSARPGVALAGQRRRRAAGAAPGRPLATWVSGRSRVPGGRSLTCWGVSPILLASVPASRPSLESS